MQSFTDTNGDLQSTSVTRVVQDSKFALVPSSPLFLVPYIVDDLSILFDYPKYQIKTGNITSLPSKVNSS